MEAAGPSMRQATPSQSNQPSPKKSPKKYPNKTAKFKQNSTNSPKRSINDPISPSPRNIPFSTPMSNQHQPMETPMRNYQNEPSHSANKSREDPVSRRFYMNDSIHTAAIENHQKKPQIQEHSASQFPAVHSLMITVQNNAVPYQRVVQDDLRHVQKDNQPKHIFQNDVRPSNVVRNDAQPQNMVRNSVQPPNVVPNSVRPQTIPQSDLQPYAVIENDVPRIVQNDVPYKRYAYNESNQAQGAFQGDAIPGRSYPRYQQQRRYDHPNRGDRRFNNKPAAKSYNMGQDLQLVNGEYQLRPNWRQAKLYENEVDFCKKVIVSGFPAYTKPEELVRKLSVLGHPQIETYKNRVALVTFSTEQEAISAVQANETMAVYGTILTISKYTTRKQLMTMIKANKRDKRNEGGPPIIAPTKLDLSGDFNQQLKNIEDAIRLTQEEVSNINLLFEDIEKYMRKIFPTCEAVPFGSITTGQGIKSSDADCFLSMGPGAAGRPGAGAAELCSQFVSRAARVLRLHPEVFSNLVAIPRANTPIIKFLHVPTNVNCDLNSKTPLGVQNSRLIGHLLRHDARFGSVALLLKYWARVHQLSGTGRLTNYALLLLLVFYLQQDLLPPVCMLQNPADSFRVENWEAGFDRSPLPFLRECPPARDLLGGFFLYYAKFNFDDLVVCPFVGKPLRKAEFETNSLPPQFALYRHNIKEGLALPVRTNSCICIQDPFELSHNVSSAVSARLAHDIKAFIKLAAIAYSQDEKVPGDFLRTVLLTRPPEPDAGAEARGARVTLPARLMADLADDWQDTMRDVVVKQMFRDVLLLELERKHHVSRDPTVHTEVYVCVARRPVWRRAHSRAAHAPLAHHKEIAHSLTHDSPDVADVYVPFEVELAFRSKPRGFTAAMCALEGAELDEFKLFRTFVNTLLHRWHRELLKPYLKQDPIQFLLKNVKPASPKKSPKRSPKKSKENNPSDSVANVPADPISAKPPNPPIETVAFVNSNHRGLSESIAAITLTDS